MSITRLKNTETSEFRDVEVGSQEHRVLSAEVGQSGLPRWEETKPMEETDDIWELDDYAREHLPSAIMLHLQGIPNDRNQHLILTRGEIDAGLTPQSKLDDLMDQYGHMIPKTMTKQEGDPEPPKEEALAKQAVTQAAATRSAAGGTSAPVESKPAETKGSPGATAPHGSQGAED
jgi:hypothetical protein